MKIKDISEENRPRERFVSRGAEALSDAELLALILRTGTKNVNVVDMGNRLISKYGLDKIFQCSLKELQQIEGIGEGKAIQLLAISEINKRVHRAEKNIEKITCPGDVFELYKERFKEEKQENFIVILLDVKNKIIKEELITRGVLDASIVDPREIFKPAIRYSASRLILVHNHPSGDPTPSPEDLDVTEKIMEAGKIVQIKVLDHVIIGRDRWWGWSESG